MKTHDVKSHPEYDHVIYLRLIESCNLYCEHCFIPSNPKKLSDKAIISALEQLKDVISENDTVLVQFHGGEPTLYGAKNLELICQNIRDMIRCAQLHISIQTNLYRLDDALLAVLARCFDEVGVSWDTEIRRVRKNDPASRHVYETQFWSNFGSLVSAGISPYVVMTATRPFFSRFINGFELMELLETHHIEKLHIERLTRTGYAIQNWESIGVSNHEYSFNMSSLARKYFMWKKANKKSHICISPFDGLCEAMQTLTTKQACGYGCWSGKCDKKFHTIDAEGYKPGCTALTVTNSELNQNKLVTFRQKRQKSCIDCKYRPVCSSGCLETPMFDESGECAGAYNLLYSVDQLQKIYSPV